MAIDWASRWRVVLETLALDNRLASAPLALRVIEERAAVEVLRHDILAAELPRPDTSMAGPAVDAACQRWVARVGGSMVWR